MKPRGCQVYLVGAILFCAVLAAVLSNLPELPEAPRNVFSGLFWSFAAVAVGIYGAVRFVDGGFVHDNAASIWAGICAAVGTWLMILNALHYNSGRATDVAINLIGAAAAVAMSLLIEEVEARREITYSREDAAAAAVTATSSEEG